MVPWSPRKWGVVFSRGKHGWNHSLIHDHRRSRVNAKLRLRERLVQPRLSEVVQDTLDLYESIDDMNEDDVEHFSEAERAQAPNLSAPARPSMPEQRFRPP